MSDHNSIMSIIGKYLYWVLLVLMFIPFELIFGSTFISAPVALFLGLVFALIFGIPHPKFNKNFRNISCRHPWSDSASA